MTKLNYFHYALVLSMFTMLASCGDDNVTGSGKYVDVNYPMRDIHSIVASDGFDLRISVEDTTSVNVRMDNNILSHIEVVKDEWTVRFGLNDKGRHLRSIFYQADVSVPRLRGLYITDASTASIVQTNTSREPFDCTISKNSDLKGTLYMTTFALQATSGSSIVIGGAADEAELNISGHTVCDLADFSIQDCDLAIDGDCTVIVNVTGRLVGTVAGGATVYYVGKPFYNDVQVEEGSTFQHK